MSASALASTPLPPYYAVIFSSLRTEEGGDYEKTAQEMLELAACQDGYLGVESTRGSDGLGITVSYWRDLASISSWKKQEDHRQAQRAGKAIWYSSYSVRIAQVERAYSFGSS